MRVNAAVRFWSVPLRTRRQNGVKGREKQRAYERGKDQEKCRNDTRRKRIIGAKGGDISREGGKSDPKERTSDVEDRRFDLLW